MVTVATKDVGEVKIVQRECEVVKME